MGHSNIYKGNHGIVGVLIVSQSKQYDDIGTVRYTGTVPYGKQVKDDSRVNKDPAVPYGTVPVPYGTAGIRNYTYCTM